MPEIMDGMSMDLERTNMDKLRSVFPECFAEGKLDIDKLLSLCGEYVSNDFEKYKFEWKGKADCLRLAQKRSTGTLRPCPEESVNWDTTQNLYIEGDNLEVLKLLQTAYYRKVKMIYIDPPYNTGNDFVYADDFADPMARYKEVTQQTTKSNPETMGRFHTNWLNMMYPRLRLAANLLRDDGVIFISIDENEVTNLKKICDEVFGEENFRTMITWQRKYSVSNNYNGLATICDYLLVYAKSSEFQNHLLPRTSDSADRYSNPDNDPRGPWKAVDYLNQATTAERPNLCYDIVNPNTGVVIKNKAKAWKYDRNTHLKHVQENRIWWGVDGKNTVPALKLFLCDVRDGMTPHNWWPYEEVGHTQEATKEVADLMGCVAFDYPKPLRFLKRILQIASDKDSIILDFFSGSASTAHAVMQMNNDDGGNRKFILVQLPEICDSKTEAYRNGYPNICEIGKERIRRAGKKLTDTDGQMQIGEEENNPLDIGFRVFKLDSSNLSTWDATPVDEVNIDDLIDRMNTMVNRVKPGRSDMDMVCEIMLKLGIPLTSTIDKVSVDTKPAYIVKGDSMLLVCLAADISPEDVEAMADYAPKKVVISRDSFANDTAMANAHYILRDRGIELKLV